MNYAIKPSIGLGDLIFGMQTKDVVDLLGNQFIKMIDDEKNQIYIYSHLQIRLTFYAEEQFRLGYIVSNHPMLQMAGKNIIGELTSEVMKQFKQIKAWETNRDDDYVTHHFNEEQWIDLHEDFFRITKVELGATIKNLDEFDWKFPLK